MILIFTGNGKGKTTAALGTLIRASGWNQKNAVVFFDKGGDHYGEQKSLIFLKKTIDIFQFGEQRFDQAKMTFRFGVLEADIVGAQHAQKKVLELFNQDYFLIVCDEIVNCLNLGMLTEAEVRQVVDAVPENTHLILTGRNCPQWLLDKADLVTEMTMKKHYFKKGQNAIEGIEF